MDIEIAKAASMEEQYSEEELTDEIESVSNFYEDTSDLWLEESEILDIYHTNGGIETKEHAVSFAKDISGSGNSLKDHFHDFISNGTERSRNVFVMVNDHWISVRLEKTTSKETSEEGITYQVADSLQGEGAEARSQKIDELFNNKGIKRVPFNSEKQQNGYDCGIYAALNAIDMNGGDLEHGLTSIKSTFSTNDVKSLRTQIAEQRQFEKDTQLALDISMQEHNRLNINAVHDEVNFSKNKVIMGQEKELNYWQNQLNSSSPDRSESGSKGGRYR